MVNGEVCAQLARAIKLPFAPSCSDDAAIEELRNLNRGGPDAGTRSKNQNRLARLNPGSTNQHVPRGQKDQRNTRGFVVGQLIWNRQNIHAGHGDQFSIAARNAVSQYGEMRTEILLAAYALFAHSAERHWRQQHPRSQLYVSYVLANLRHITRDVASGNLRERNSGHSLPYKQIQVVQRHSLDAYEDLVLPQDGIRHILVSQYFRSTMFVEPYGFHRSTPRNRKMYQKGRGGIQHSISH